jgi:glyoxylate/hydroxypyruvate reductase A
MALLFISENDDPSVWKAELAKAIPGLEVRIWPDSGDAGDIEFALAWNPPPGLLASFPNLRFIQALGMGIDHFLTDPDLPKTVPLARLVDPDMARQMSEFVVHAVLRFHRQATLYAHHQDNRLWRQEAIPDTGNATVGIMGLGVLGADAAAKLDAIGFRVRGWSLRPHDAENIESFHGPNGFEEFMRETQFLVCLLPLNGSTADIINKDTLGMLPEGAYVINVARGGHVVEDDLLDAVNSGHIAGAALDVFRSEPLAPDHPFWPHPKIHVTPHIAALTNPITAARLVAENIRRAADGQPPDNLIDPKRGY